MSISSEVIVVSEKRVRVQTPDISSMRVIDFVITPALASIEDKEGYTILSCSHDELRDVCLKIIQALPEKKVMR